MRVLWCCTVLALAPFVGCTVDVETSTTSEPSTETGTPDAGTPEEGTTNEEGSATREEESTTVEEGSGTVASEPPAEPKRVKADVGAAKQGRSLDEYETGVEAVIAEPAKAFFGFREKMVFQNLIPKYMQMYKGEHGSAPKTHEKFMSKIIEANKVQLPELPPGRKYVYDPEKEELMVQR